MPSTTVLYVYIPLLGVKVGLTWFTVNDDEMLPLLSMPDVFDITAGVILVGSVILVGYSESCIWDEFLTIEEVPTINIVWTCVLTAHTRNAWRIRCNFKRFSNSPFTSAQYINCSNTNSKNRPTTTTRNINKESALIGTVNQISIISMFGSIVTDQVAHDGWLAIIKGILMVLR